MDILYQNVLHKHFKVHGSEPKEEIVTLKLTKYWINEQIWIIFQLIDDILLS